MRTELVLAFAAMTVATLFSRSFFTVLVSRVRISSFWEQYLSFIPFAVLSAMVTPYLLLPGGNGKISLLNPWIIAGSLSLLVSYRTKSLFLSVGCGIAVFFVLGIFLQ